MKLTPRQKELLKSIENKNLRKEIKKEFKKKITFYHTRWKLLDEVEPIVFENGKLETDNPKIQEFLSNHPMCKKNKLTDEFISPEKEYKVKVEIVKDEKLKGTGYEDCFFKVTIPIGTPIQDSLNAVDEFFKQKTEIGNKIISEEKEKELFLNNQFLQDFLDKCNNLKILQNFKTKCVKYQNYEYATKFRQKVWDILVTLSTEKLIDLVQDGTIELSDMSRAVGRKKDKSANDNPKQFTLEDMRKAYFTAVVDYLINSGKHEYNGEILFKKFIESLKNPS